MSLYTHKAESHDDKDEWIRKPALLVLIYEGIVANVLDYDYAPQSELIENRRVYLNISQEGKSDVEFLREEELLNGLQIASKSYKPVTCYQISEKGLELVKRISQKEKEATHEFVYAKGTRELLSATWDGSNYHLTSASGYKRQSTITETEDVSYVSSAYVPQCLRYGGRPTLSNAHRAHESAVNTDSIRDELDEVITLNSVSIIVAEYIPFGANLDVRAARRSVFLGDYKNQRRRALSIAPAAKYTAPSSVRHRRIAFASHGPRRLTARRPQVA